MLTHGLRIGLNQIDNLIYLHLEIIGTLTHHDYDVLVPMLDSAIDGAENARIDALVDLRQLEGIELRAMWDDLKLGLKHRKRFERIAVLGNRKWEQVATRVGNWFVSGQLAYFEQETEAKKWILSTD